LPDDSLGVKNVYVAWQQSPKTISAVAVSPYILVKFVIGICGCCDQENLVHGAIVRAPLQQPNPNLMSPFSAIKTYSALWIVIAYRSSYDKPYP